MNNNRKYSIGDYITDNPIVLVLCFGFTILLSIVAKNRYDEGAFEDASGIFIINGILTGSWLIAFTIDYFKMRAKGKRGEL